MEFAKLHGSGNDFIAMSNLDGQLDGRDASALAVALCARHTGIGADGLFIVQPSQRADFEMTFYNADGSVGEMCGNGVMCFSRFLAELGHQRDEYLIATRSGPITTWSVGGHRYRVKLAPASVQTEITVDTLLGPVRGDYLELGDPGLPHFCVLLPELAEREPDRLGELGARLRHAPEFPRGANVNFYAPLPDGQVRLRTYERGVEDFTLACGTGSGCVGLLLAAAGPAGNEPRTIAVQSMGGTLTVEVVPSPGKAPELYLTGNTTLVCQGVVSEDLVPPPTE